MYLLSPRSIYSSQSAVLTHPSPSPSPPPSSAPHSSPRTSNTSPAPRAHFSSSPSLSPPLAKCFALTDCGFCAGPLQPPPTCDFLPSRPSAASHWSRRSRGRCRPARPMGGRCSLQPRALQPDKTLNCTARLVRPKRTKSDQSPHQ